MRLDRRQGLLAVVLCSALMVAACGDSKSPTTPTPPPGGGGGGGNPPPTQTNRNPVIGSMTFSPELAVSELTTVTFNASASDPDGDQVSYKWEFNTASGFSDTRQSFSARLTGSGTLAVKLTVTDGKGGTATQTRNLAVGNMSGTWRGNGQVLGTFSLNLTQSGGRITGTMATVLGPGQLDPAQPGTIDDQGNVQMRVKTSIYTDFNFRGRMDVTGTRITGQIFGSGFEGETFSLVKQ